MEYLGSAVVGGQRVTGLLSAKETQIVLRLKERAKNDGLRGTQTEYSQIWLPKGEKEMEEITLDEVKTLMEKLRALGCDALDLRRLPRCAIPMKAVAGAGHEAALSNRRTYIGYQ